MEGVTALWRDLVAEKLPKKAQTSSAQIGDADDDRSPRDAAIRMAFLSLVLRHQRVALDVAACMLDVARSEMEAYSLLDHDADLDRVLRGIHEQHLEMAARIRDLHFVRQALRPDSYPTETSTEVKSASSSSKPTVAYPSARLALCPSAQLRESAGFPREQLASRQVAEELRGRFGLENFAHGGEEKEENRKHVILSFSGGVDSTAHAFIMKALGIPFVCMFMRYANRASEETDNEMEWVQYICDVLEVRLFCVKIDVQRPHSGDSSIVSGVGIDNNRGAPNSNRPGLKKNAITMSSS